MKRIFALAMLIGLFVGDPSMSQELNIVENLRHERIVLPPSAPKRDRIVIVDTLMFVEAGNGAGVLVFYNDPRTKFDIDYIELYDVEGNLLVIAWIDQFGICQVAMDRGLLNNADQAVEGTFVMVNVGLAL